MGNHKIITILFLALIPYLVKAQDPDWPRFELYQLVQGQDSGIFVITDSDSNLVFTDLLKMRFFPDTALIFNGDTIAVKPDIPTFVEGLGISIEYDPVLNQYLIESLSIQDSIHNGTASLITKGTPLYAAGVQGNYWSVAPADAGNSAKMPVVIIAGEDIAAGEDGLGLIKGHIKQVNTTGLADGAEVYVAVGGGYTATKPKGENAIVQRLGTVIKGNSTNGSGIINLGDPRTTSNLNPDKIFIGGADSTVTTINIKTLISDSLFNYATKVQLSDTALAIRNSIPLVISDSLVNYATKDTLNFYYTKVQVNDTLNVYVLKTALTDSINSRFPITLGTQTDGNYIATGATSGNGISGSATGEGSTFTVTSNATTLNTANTIVFRDGSGNFKAGVIEGNLAGIAREVQSNLTPGQFITPSDTYNGSLARTFNVDTTVIAHKNWVNAILPSGGVTGTFTNGSVPYAATAGSALTNSGWYISSGNLIDRIATPSYKLDVNGSIGGTSLTVSGAITGQTLSTVRGATFNTEQDAYDFTINGDLLSGLFVAKGLTNRIGIGGITPDYTLDVDGDMNLRTGHVYRIAGTPLVGSQWTTTGSDIYYNSGRVGIGMTAPTSTLHVTGDIRGTDDLNIDNGTFFVDASENAVGIGTSSPQFLLDVVGTARIDGSTFFVSSGDDRVGIGTGTPGYKLDVVGDVNISSGSNFRIAGTPIGTTTINNNAANRIITGSNTSNTLEAFANINVTNFPQISFYNATTGNTGTDGTLLYLGNSSKTFLINNVESDGEIDFLINNTSRLKIISNGNIGIGVTSTNYKLEVDGDAKVDSLFYNGLQQLSDKSIKTNIKPIKNQLENITKLNPVSFEFNDKIETRKGQKGIGLIAQELEEIYPNLVSNTREDLKSVSYIDLIPYLISAMQEQQTQIEELKAEVKQLKKKRKQN